MEQDLLHIISYIKGELSEQDVIIIEKRMAASSEYRKEVNNIRFIYDLYGYTDENSLTHINHKWELLKKEIKENRKRKRIKFIYRITEVAAILILFISIGVLFHTQSKQEIVSAIEKIERPDTVTSEIQLILADTKKMDIEEDNSKIKYTPKGELTVNSKQINIKQSTLTTAQKKIEVKYNQLVVPKGKRSHLTLSDGTKIWVNADSRVVYPTTFEEDKREIYVDGEIFIEVYPNKEQPFYVKTNKLDVKVLGTSFNVSSFDDEENVSVVLVTGKVNVETKNNKKTELEPNHLLTFQNGNIRKQEVDVEKYISWKDGYLRFEHEKFKTILKKLSRFYGKEITYSKEVENLYCSGTLNLQDNIENQLQGICNTVPIEFTIDPDQIKIQVKH